MNVIEAHERRRAHGSSTGGGSPKFVWSPEYWKGWRGADDPYRQRKSRRDLEIALELLDLRSGDRVLEIGCGYGWISRAILRVNGVRWTGMDASYRMLEELRGSVVTSGPAVFAGDAHSLAFPDATFDKVLCSGVLMHLADPARALREMARVLSPTGRLVVSVNNALSPLATLVRLHNLRKRGYIQRFGRPAEYAADLEAMGFDIRDVRGDGILTSVSIAGRGLTIPPRFAFAALSSLDDWAVERWPRCAYEVWFSGVKRAPAAARQ